jgi:uncharacterized protein YkwD
MFLAVLATALTTFVSGVAHSAPARAQQPALPPASVVAAINDVRAARSLRPLTFSRELSSVAGQHSREMGTRGYFAHKSFDGTSFWKRIARYYGSGGYRSWSVGENLLWSSGSLTAKTAVDLWMKSPRHRRNLLDPRWQQAGVSALRFAAAPGPFRGLDVTILTADFGRRY